MTDQNQPDSTPKAAGSARIPRTPEGTLATALLAYAVINGLFGLVLLFFPRFLLDTVGGGADIYDRAFDLFRFSGGALVALAIGALMVLRKPEGQHSLVTVMAIEATLVAAAVIANIAIDDTPTDLWFELIIAIVCAVLAAYLWWARIRARKILGFPA